MCRYSGEGALAVDPCDSSTVLRAISDKKLQLTDVLVTHHHRDHTAGVAELKKTTGCRVIGSDEKRIGGIDLVVGDGDVAPVGDTKIEVIATPGHTGTSVCYYMPTASEDGRGIVWTGDTMFAGGCGRVLECGMEAMWESLSKLATLPEDTLVYCGHDYTEENFEFALSIIPSDPAIQRRLKEVWQVSRQGGYTVPSTIGQEKKTNIFSRVAEPVVKGALHMDDASAVEVFAELRRRKDRF